MGSVHGLEYVDAHLLSRSSHPFIPRNADITTGLGDYSAAHPFLRKQLGYKRVSFYYFAMVIDPILRFNWIFYIIFKSNMQHSALLSFSLSLSEIIRRGIWTVIRVENEHCTK